RAVPIKVFIAEDSPMMRERVAAMLAARGVTTVGQGDTPQACIDGILAAHPDVVVLDAKLEGGTGLAVLRAVRQQEASVEFVVFTINADPTVRAHYLAEGARGVLDKATEFEQLATAVEQAALHAQT